MFVIFNQVETKPIGQPISIGRFHRSATHIKRRRLKGANAKKQRMVWLWIFMEVYGRFWAISMVFNGNSVAYKNNRFGFICRWIFIVAIVQKYFASQSASSKFKAVIQYETKKTSYGMEWNTIFSFHEML